MLGTLPCVAALLPAAVHPFDVVQEMGHQLANMAMLYVLIGLLNKRARKAGDNAARQVCSDAGSQPQQQQHLGVPNCWNPAVVD